jgi:hypothetical protein
MRPEEQPEAPSAPWRAASAFTMGAVGLLCKGFLSGLNRVETHGLEGFLKLLDEREDVDKRERGLITGMQQHSGISGYLTLASIEPHIRVGTVKPSHTRS